MKTVQVVKLFIRYIFKGLVIGALAFVGVHHGNAQSDSLSIYVPDSTFFQRKAEADSFRIIQEAEKESLRRADRVTAVDTTSRFGLLISVDYGKILTLPTKFETKYEGMLGLILFRRLVLEGVYGSGELNPNNAYKNSEFYTIEGTYYKAGLQYRFILNPANPRDFLYIGASYAMANYSDRGRFSIGSELWEEYQGTFGSEDLEANWAEVYLVTEAYLNKKTNRFLVGLKLSLRIMNKFESRNDIPVYAIPGYGRTLDNTVPALNFFLKYRLPF